MNRKILIVGGGIGGMAAALACALGGAQVCLLEQRGALAEVGAGIQLGPNALRVLQSWGLGDALRAVAAFPAQLEVRNAVSASLLAVLPLGASMVQRYGAAYATVARADLHCLLCEAVGRQGSVQCTLNARVESVSSSQAVAELLWRDPSAAQPLPQALQADALVAADGLWSRVREQLLNDGAPRATGHVAFRAMVAQDGLPPDARSQVVRVWLGPDFHAVQYPVRGGDWLNVVVIVRGFAPAQRTEPQPRGTGAVDHWSLPAHARELHARLAHACPALLELLQAIADWRAWALYDRPPMHSAAQHAVGRVALLGDAAHPMRPYLAQGAGMALEDAAELARVLALPGLGVAQALQRYAANRWQRNARVQARSMRNGEIFHLKGPMRVGRDLSLKLLGQQLLDIPWLYSGPQKRAPA